MADPLSIATGIITFVGACQALASTIQKLHHLRKAPQELEELETEILSLQSYSEGIKQLVDMHSCDQDQVIGRMSLGLHIENARKKIQKIQQFLENSLLDTSSMIKIRTRAWLKWQSEFKRLRQELRDVRLEIGSCIGLFSAFTLPCNEHACSQRQKALVRIQYSFPVWSLIQQMLTMVSFSGGARGPEKILRMSRIRPGLDEAFIQVQGGNTNRLKQLFVKGDASPFDASDTGWTLLHYALAAGQYKTAKFLADAGADIHAESTGRKTPFDVSWNRILSGRLDSKSELLLRGVFSDDDQLDERQFTPLHKIILGMIGRDLAKELEVSTAYIDAVDSSGYTPLAWASARGDHESVNLLLKYGASLGIANNSGEEAIHLAAQTGNIDTIRVLVQAGADVNKEVRLTYMTPMHYAAEYQDSSGQVLGLAALGARVNAEDYYCWTPLHWASWRGHFASLSALLKCDASVLCRTNDGNAPIMLAVANNSHQCVQRLIEAGADASVVRDSHWNVLHYAAIGGSLDTLRSLRAADVSGVDLHGLKTKDTGQTVLDMVTARLEALSMDENGAEKHESWKTAWDEVAKKTSLDDEVKDDDLNTFRNPSRSDTDSTYHDADDQPFEHRHEALR
ncbi:hypothetical protein P7C71_g5624, partial [Lecanoromycetidae sp. Uapishka_2]